MANISLFRKSVDTLMLMRSCRIILILILVAYPSHIVSHQTIQLTSTGQPMNTIILFYPHTHTPAHRTAHLAQALSLTHTHSKGIGHRVPTTSVCTSNHNNNLYCRVGISQKALQNWHPPSHSSIHRNHLDVCLVFCNRIPSGKR